ncbi:glutamate synthase subunit beta [Azonexus sp.]|uniref:glutamate synthase subunit beta n=1 Tax=Azonexus sp. TaxID=1872668 RepID=UPI0039E5A2F4
MGKPTGFLEFARQHEAYDPVSERLQHYREFVHPLSEVAARTQGARCMDCGVPFCNNACPVNNLIPDWNDLVYGGQWQAASERLHRTNNFPEFTSRICPAPCEAACTLGINDAPVGIKSIERAIIDTARAKGWISPQPASKPTGRRVAIVGSGPAGLAAAQQLARAGHAVTVFEKNDAIGGLLRYGIPDFKLDKILIDQRVAQLEAEGVHFELRTLVGDALPHYIANDATRTIAPERLLREFDAVLLAGGAETPRDLPIPGRELAGVHFALDYLIAQNKEIGGGAKNPIDAHGKHVIVIGGGDTGSDCVGTANRQGAASVTQIELLPKPPGEEKKPLTWPYWPQKLRSSSSHEEGCGRDWAIASQEFLGENGQLTALRCARLTWQNGTMQEIPDSSFELKAELVFLAMGFTQPSAALLESFAINRDSRGNAAAGTDDPNGYATNIGKVFAAGDLRRGQSLVVWAIREGRQAARAIDRFLMGETRLPR